MGDEFVVKSIPKELKVVIAVDTGDGALIGQDPDDSPGGSGASMAKRTLFSSSLHAGNVTLKVNSTTIDVDNTTSAHYHIVYKRSTANAKRTKSDISEDGFLMSESIPEAATTSLHGSDYGK